MDWQDAEAVKAYKRARYYATRESSAPRRAANRERARAQTRAWIEARPGYRRAWQLRRLYGLGPGEFDAMLAEQGGCCAICRIPQAGQRTFHVDHKGPVLRGLLCASCNAGTLPRWEAGRGTRADRAHLIPALTAYVARNWTRRIPDDSPILDGWPYARPVTPDMVLP